MIKELPDEKGTYVAYVNGPISIVADRIFLTWDGARWCYPFSDQKYRDHVYQCIGPLPNLRLE